jgi:hypothetical protein
MDSPFSFLAKFIGAPARVSAPFALAALVIYALRRPGVELVASDSPTYQIIMWVGVIGFCVCVVELVRWAWAKLQRRYEAWAVRKLHKCEAMKNLEVLPPDFSATLRYLKAKNMKRFPEQANNDLLCVMSKSFLLEIDDRLYSSNTYYEVPDCVWEKIDRIDSNLPVPKSPPWWIVHSRGFSRGELAP